MTRREALCAGGLSLFGMSLPDLLRAEGVAASRRGGQARSVILLYLFGGPPQHDTFDPKPDAPVEIRGDFGSIETSLPGVRICEHLPKTASWMHRSALVRSATHPHNDHSAGLLYTMTGRKAQRLESLVPVLATQAPSMNSAVSYVFRDEPAELPRSVWMPCYTGWGQGIRRPGPYAGFLGSSYDPFITTCAPTSDGKSTYAHPLRVGGEVTLEGLAPQPGITIDRLDRRRSLLSQLDDGVRKLERGGRLDDYDRYTSQALEMVTGGAKADGPWSAFRLEAESDKLRARYGKNLYGNSTLIARRLVERGVRFVTVTWEVFEKLKIDEDGWDTHQRNFAILKDHRLPVFDAAYSALCEDLDSRGLLDETLVVVMGEMGRSPRVNQHAGRDHWSYCYDVLLTGAGIQQGTVLGASDKIGAYPTRDPVGPEDVIATIYEAMGIDSSATIPDQLGRPQPIAQHGQPVRKILA